MRYTIRRSAVQVTGVLWLPQVTGATEYLLSGYDVENIRAAGDGTITREAVRWWVDTHAGDFSRVTDFAASIEDGCGTLDFPWELEESEVTYGGCTWPEEEY